MRVVWYGMFGGNPRKSHWHAKTPAPLFQTKLSRQETPNSVGVQKDTAILVVMMIYDGDDDDDDDDDDGEVHDEEKMRMMMMMMMMMI